MKTLQILACAWLLSGAGFADSVHHRLAIQLDPATHTLQVTDRLTLEGDTGTEFLLASPLRLTANPAVVEVPTGDLSELLASDEELPLEVRRYRITGDERELELHFAGKMEYGLSDQKEEYTRGFRDSAGWIGEEGVYLAGRSFWVPVFGPGLVTFELSVGTPDGWHLISQGDGTSRDEAGIAHWSSEQEMDEIYLVGGPLLRWRESAGKTEALVYLREKDDALAQKYLETTAQYLEMYRGLIGPYPYSKFALVENFWETGFGMPSFTLLGPSIIRFPFILHSSYPHEILHNWWGNSVFVEWQKGNWSEGLTAYLADHLIQEQRGRGEAYRRDTLQKYRSFVRDGLDFPLVEFRSRHSAATEAVGYGKTLMVFHMLRRELGDETFRLFLQRFYRNFRGKRASFDDVEYVASEASGRDLAPYFQQWVNRKGAPDLALEAVEVEATENAYVVHGQLRQRQEDDPFFLQVPVEIVTEAGQVTEMLSMPSRTRDFSIEVAERPLALRIDSHFDLFRLLDPLEIPSSIGQLFGAPKILAVLPDSEAASYEALLDAWRTENHQIETVPASELDWLPDDRMVWVLGEGNPWAEKLFAGDLRESIELAENGVKLAGEEVFFAGHSLVLLRRHPGNDELAVGWITLGSEAAGPGLARKLPHYGKYSYLAFEGDEPTNVLKGQWSSSGSPLVADLRPASERQAQLPEGQAADRVALAELPPVFSEKALLAHVEKLADPALQGRGIGTAGLDEAAEYVAEAFRAAGLEPAGDDHSYFQTFELPGPDGKNVEVRNVLGRIRGSRGDWSGQSVVLAAHYDHLGLGWPDVHAGDEGQVHPGADDNASGVAVLLELLRVFAAGDPPPRTLTFAAFTAEEAQLAGSRHWLDALDPAARGGILAAVNLDTVGRLHDGKLSVLGTGTATEWPHIVRGVGFVTGVEARSVADMTDASDQQSFVEKGIPGVQIFSGAHDDYHRPGDTADEIDAAGLVQVATFVRETVGYLVEREEPMTVTIDAVPSAAPKPSAAPQGGRRVRLGTLPDFAFPGPGVRVDSVSEDSPAARAGIQAGDLLVALAGQEIADLRSYSEILKTLEPDQTVTAVVEREGERLQLEVTVEAR